ncbi:MAG: alpha-amylase family glycosyl hydrolase [Bacilli bacterium]|nr:alpha-amylase family glycosyl hydrolase [Bacilli bacterium]
MKKQFFALSILPFLMLGAACSPKTSSSSPSGGSHSTSSSTSSDDDTGRTDYSSYDEPDDPTKYDQWLNSWSKPGHVYFHYNRGSKGGYENYCLWLWQHAPQDLEGTLWAYSGQTQVSPTLKLIPMSTGYMSAKEVGKEGDGEYLDSHGMIIDIDMTRTDLKSGKSGENVSFDGATSLGFLMVRQNSMDGSSNWVSDGGRETYIDDFADPANWRSISGGKTMHIFLSTGSFSEYSYFAGDSSEVKINPIDSDETGNYRSGTDTILDKYGVSSTSDAFSSLGVGYQIFVASFKDSDGDGLGDIKGVIDSLDYLSDLGVQALWLTPIQQSDSYHGYDISDYYAVDPKFGTIDDYRELLYKAHQKGMKVVMDLVLNHTSKNNPWFIKSQWGEETRLDDGNVIKWRDVYTWKYKTDTIRKANIVATSNGGYKISGYTNITVEEDAKSNNPSWYRDGESNYYYYGKFGSGMPEINYENKATRQLIIDMAKYWMSFGLDGFRLDAVKHIYMADEAYSSSDIIIEDVGKKTAYDEERGQEITKEFNYSSNLTKNLTWWKEFAGQLKAIYPNCFLVGENFDGWGTRTAPYYQALDSQFSFSTYYHIPAYIYNNDGGASAYANVQPQETFVPFAGSGNFVLDNGVSQVTIPGGSRPDFIDGAFTSNHDVNRAINQVNGTGTSAGTTAKNKITGATNEVNKAKIHGAITMLNPGVSWIYYGDELGMSGNTDQHVSKYGNENSIDVWYRQPFLWKDVTKRANYKAGKYVFELDAYNKTLPSAEDQQKDANSMYNWYKGINAIKRMYPKNAKVAFDSSSSKNVLVINVTGNGKAMKIFMNVGTSTNSWSINVSGYKAVASVGTSLSTVNIGAAAYSVVAYQQA